MSDITQQTLHAKRFQRALQQVYEPKAAQIVVPLGAKEELYALAAKTIGDFTITYLEFGVFKGWSIGQMAKRFSDPKASFIGFDSFEGLPEKWGGYEVGQFTTSGAPPAVKDERIRFCKGWFQNTFPTFLQANPLSGSVLVHFDADLYSSTLFLLTTLWHNCPDYYFLFDEFSPDEVIALHDFASAYPVEMDFFACTKVEAMPMQVFGHLKNVPFRLGTCIEN